MTTPMSLQPWWWQIFILIQLWSQFFQMFVYGDVVYAQTWYWPWKTVSSHLHMPGRPMLLQYGPHFFSTLSWSFGQLARCFWANGLPPPPGKNFPYAYVVNANTNFSLGHVSYVVSFLRLSDVKLLQSRNIVPVVSEWVFRRHIE